MYSKSDALFDKHVKAAHMDCRTREAVKYRETLWLKTKNEVFNVWIITPSVIHNVSINEQRKSWMIYDIIKAKYGKVIADVVG